MTGTGRGNVMKSEKNLTISVLGLGVMGEAIVAGLITKWIDPPGKYTWI